ncbi:MAG: rod-binding protein [Armatimonadota bacterium]
MKVVPPIAQTQMYGPATLEGRIGTIGKVTQGETRSFDVPLTQSSTGTSTNYDGFPSPPKASFIRADFANELQSRMDNITATTGIAKMSPDELDDQAKRELKKLQGAAEGFESHFVKDLLGQMRKSAFSEKDSPTSGMAKDMMDQQLADQTAKSQHGMGIAKMLFGKMGEQVVRQAVARTPKAAEAGDKPK